MKWHEGDFVVIPVRPAVSDLARMMLIRPLDCPWSVFYYTHIHRASWALCTGASSAWFCCIRTVEYAWNSRCRLDEGPLNTQSNAYDLPEDRGTGGLCPGLH